MPAVFFLLFSCHNAKNGNEQGDGADTPPDSMAVYYYNMRSTGQFEAYIEAMQSCDHTTPAYKEGIVRMLRHHQAQINKEKKGVKSVTALRTELHNHGKMANVFLAITYKDDSHEEIIFPLVLDGRTWRIQ